uniref:hypothetical protein n=1 Tax=Streptococcus pneumoniae TaxID=1313 RepID=UPI0019530DC9
MNIIAHVEIPVYGEVFDIAFGETVIIHEDRMAFFPFGEGQDGASGACSWRTYVPTPNGAIVSFNVHTIDLVIE